MMQFRILVALVISLLTVGHTYGQHVDILVFDAGGRVGVGEYDYDNGVASEQLVHLGRFTNQYAVNNPGFTAFSGPDSLPGSAALGWDFLPLTVDSGPHAGYRSNLLYWDGVGSTPTFGPTPASDYELTMFGRNNPATADGGSYIVPGDVIDVTDPDGSLHRHRFYFLDDNGDGQITTLPDPGIYLLGLQLSIAGLDDSRPVFAVFATPELSVLPAIQPAASWVNDRIDTLYVEAMPGDFVVDDAIDGADFLAWQRDPDHFGGAAALSDWQSNYGTGVTPASVISTVPEPDTITSLASFVAIAQLIVRRRLRRHLLG